MSEELAIIHAEPEASTKRRMPDTLRKYLIPMAGGKSYLPVQYRVVWFRDEMGDDWGIITDLIEGGHEAGFATSYTKIVNPDGRVVATAMKTETKQDFKDFIEKSGTGSVGRALGLLGFGTQFMPELDEMPRVVDSPQHPRGEAQSAPVAATAAIWPGPGQCPRCHAPEGKRHGKQCQQDGLMDVPAQSSTVEAIAR